MASGNHLCPCLRYFSRNPSSGLMETHFSVQKKTYSCLLRTFFPASGNHYQAYLKLLLQPFCFIFPIFLSVGTDFLFSKNGILLSTEFFRDFCKTTLQLLVEAKFAAIRDDFFLPFSDIPSTVSFIFLTDINVLLKRILHSVWWKPIFCLMETFFSTLQILLVVKAFSTSSIDLFFSKSFILAGGN